MIKENNLHTSFDETTLKSSTELGLQPFKFQENHILKDGVLIERIPQDLWQEKDSFDKSSDLNKLIGLFFKKRQLPFEFSALKAFGLHYSKICLEVLENQTNCRIIGCGSFIELWYEGVNFPAMVWDSDTDFGFELASIYSIGQNDYLISKSIKKN